MYVTDWYAHYKYVRNESWQILVDLNIVKFPISALWVARRMGVTVEPYQTSSEVLSRYGFGEEMRTASGFTIRDGPHFMVFYDDTMVNGRKRFTLLHELSHILLGHVPSSGGSDRPHILCRYNTGDLNKHPRTPKEQEADMMAARLLAPACALWGLGLHDWQDIRNVCGMSNQAAQYRAERMEELYKRNMFLAHPLERDLYAQLYPWIQSIRPEAPTSNRIWRIQ